MEPRSGPSAPEPRWAVRRPFVACIDDEPEMLHTYGRLLRNEPVELLTFQNPAQALAWVNVVPVEVVLADERMPGMSGTELLEEVGRRSPRTRLALVTAFPDSEVVNRRTGAPIRRVFTKPLSPDDLKASIRRLLRDPVGGRPGSESVPQDRRRIELAPAKVDPLRLMATIDLAGASRDSVLDQLLPLAIWAHASGERPVVNLRNPHRSAAPLAVLLEDLDRTLERLDARILVRDESGQVAQLLRARGGDAGRQENPLRNSSP